MSAIARWDGFLAQIEDRHKGVRAEAEGSARAFIAQIAGGGDYLPLSHQLMAINHRLMELETKIIDTWDEKVDDAITGEGNSTAERDRQRAKGQSLKENLEDLREELEPRIFAELARQRFTQAQAQHQPTTCQHCRGQIAAPPAFNSYEMACTACGKPTLVEPSELLRSVAAVGTHAVAQEATNAEWRMMKNAERAMRAYRPPYPIESIKANERAQITYWFKYISVRSQFEPVLARDPAREVRDRMEQWYTMFAEHEESWRAAGRPRERF
jgi:hypothetical protein